MAAPMLYKSMSVKSIDLRPLIELLDNFRYSGNSVALETTVLYILSDSFNFSSPEVSGLTVSLPLSEWN